MLKKLTTDIQCRQAKPGLRPDGKPVNGSYKLSAGNGLYLEVKANGVKAWRYRFEIREGDAVRESVFALGNYVGVQSSETNTAAEARRAGGGFTLAEAIRKVADLRALVKQGISPVKHRQQAKIKRAYESAVTFEVVAGEWVALRDWEETTKARRIDMLRRVVFPKLGRHPVRDVTPAQVLDVLRVAVKDNGPSVAAEAQRSMSGVFDLAVATLRADTNPVYPVRKALPANKTQHKRPLTVIEIGRLLRDVGGHGGRLETISAFWLMWWTLCRPSEAAEAEWSEFDLDAKVWRIPAARMKARGDDHLVPLPAQAIDMLRTLVPITGKYRHVFPGRDDRTKPMAVASLRQMLLSLGWAGEYSPHATRTTGSTRLNELGFSSDWIERQLAHKEPNRVRATYNHAMHFTDRAAMMTKWADLLDSWKSGASNVESIKRIP